MIRVKQYIGSVFWRSFIVRDPEKIKYWRAIADFDTKYNIGVITKIFS